jgi:hypothetical protein
MSAKMTPEMAQTIVRRNSDWMPNTNVRRVSADCLFEGDTVLRNGEPHTVQTIECDPSGIVAIRWDEDALDKFYPEYMTFLRVV